MSDVSPLDAIRDAIEAIKVVRKAFGAPGDHGYGTPEGDALLGLYRARVNLDTALHSLGDIALTGARCSHE